MGTVAPQAREISGVRGYTLVLPPGWERIPVRSETNQAIKAILDAQFRKLPAKTPRDKIMPYRVRVEGYLRKAAAQARKQGGIDLYLPVEFRNGTPLPASFVISEGSLATGGTLASADLIAGFAEHDGDSATTTIAGGIALRSERAAQPEATGEGEYASRRVHYIVPVPGEGGRWLLAAFSVIAGEDAPGWFANLLVELFAAMMSTFR